MYQPKSINGIITRNVSAPFGTQQPDFDEDMENRSGVFTTKTDGFTFRNGSQVVSWMDGKGSFHPRRFIFPVTFGYSMDAGANQTVNLIICQDGPRVTISLANALDVTNVAQTAGNVNTLDKNLPASVCPIASMGKIYCPVVWNVTPRGEAQIKDYVGGFIVNPNGILGFYYPVVQDHLHVDSFSVTYDTGAY